MSVFEGHTKWTKLGKFISIEPLDQRTLHLCMWIMRLVIFIGQYYLTEIFCYHDVVYVFWLHVFPILDVNYLVNLKYPLKQGWFNLAGFEKIHYIWKVEKKI